MRLRRKHGGSKAEQLFSRYKRGYREDNQGMFSSGVCNVVTGGRKENAALLEKKFDFIFFTGSQNVGKEVLRHTAETLTPAVLELGGKSPCIVDGTAKLRLAAKRIVFGKYLNCGQTCVAPDYVLCHSSIKDRFVKEVCDQIRKQYGEDPLSNPDYGKIINEKHFERLCGLIDKNKTVCGGEANRRTCQISPTVMEDVSWDDAVMQEEIFGPIMPILTFDSIDEVCHDLAGESKASCALSFLRGSQDDRKSHRKVCVRRRLYQRHDYPSGDERDGIWRRR